MVQPNSPGTEVLMPDEGEAPLASRREIRPMLTEAAIQAITYDLKMAEKLVTTALEEMIDYGQIPGVSGTGLWDPGASKIMNAFQTYPRHKVLYHEETDTLITWAIEAEIINRSTQQIVGSGVGACSTREPKYKYRWVSKEEAKRLGYSEPEIDNMKTKKRKFRNDEGKYFDVTEFRVENPEYGEQVNTIMQMAAKRAETDAAKTLPGVASALRKLFEPSRPVPRGVSRKPDTAVEDTGEDSPRWTTFWNAAKDLLGEDYRNKTHQLLGVSSMSDWLKKGKNLDNAIRIISEKLTQKAAKSNFKPRDEWEKITKADIPDYETLEQKMKTLAGRAPAEIYRELGGGSKIDMSFSAWEAFLTLKRLYFPDIGPEEEPEDPM